MTKVATQPGRFMMLYSVSQPFAGVSVRISPASILTFSQLISKSCQSDREPLSTTVIWTWHYRLL
jgi:hypothetical protein